MNKIKCDICGTTYQDTAASCPICGWSHNGTGITEDELDLGMDFLEEEVQEAYTEEAAPEELEPVTDKKSKAIFDYDAVNTAKKRPNAPAEETEAPAEDEVEEYDDEEPRTNTLLVVLLVIVIVALLAATGYMLVRFFLPGRAVDQPEETIPVASAEAVESMAQEENPTVPCTNLALPNGIDVLNEQGQNWLLHVIVLPEDTTDEITYTSENEQVATVDAEGKVTAVGEGETNIVVTCGDQKITCPVTVRYEEETEAPTEESTEATEAAANTEATGENGATTETKDSSDKKDVVLKLKKDDIQLGRYGVYTTLELDCDLKPEDVEWSSNNMYVAGVDEQGRVTALGPGLANITVKYGDQEVICIVRCRF